MLLRSIAWPRVRIGRAIFGFHSCLVRSPSIRVHAQQKVSFNRINRKTGNRLKQQNIDSETGDVVTREDTARGFEVAKGQYVIVEDKEIDAVQIESTRTIEIDQFVPRSEIDDRYIDSPYYIAPDGVRRQ